MEKRNGTVAVAESTYAFCAGPTRLPSGASAGFAEYMRSYVSAPRLPVIGRRYSMVVNESGRRVSSRGAGAGPSEATLAPTVKVEVPLAGASVHPSVV